MRVEFGDAPGGKHVHDYGRQAYGTLERRIGCFGVKGRLIIVFVRKRCQ